MDQIMNGSEAMARAAELSGVKAAPIFPITPQTTVIEELSKGGKVETFRGNSEYQVMSLASGMAWAGTRVFAVTSSQGLIIMGELMWETVGNRLPIVMGIFGRALKGPGWALGPQQNDSLMMRDTGWLIFYLETAQEILDFIIIAYKIAEQIRLPVMVCGDGFFLSHTKEVISVPDETLVTGFLPESPPTEGLPDVDAPVTYAPLVTPSEYSNFYQGIHNLIDSLPEGQLEPICDEFEERFGRRYRLVETFGADDAEIVIVATSAIVGTVRAFLNNNCDKYPHVRLVKLRSLRPFPVAELVEAIGDASKIVVIDRNLSPGEGGIFASETMGAIHRAGVSNIPAIYSVVAGLGGEPFTAEGVKEVIEIAETTDRPEKVYFIHQATRQEADSEVVQQST